MDQQKGLKILKNCINASPPSTQEKDELGNNYSFLITSCLALIAWPHKACKPLFATPHHHDCHHNWALLFLYKLRSEQTRY